MCMQVCLPLMHQHKLIATGPKTVKSNMSPVAHVDASEGEQAALRM